MRKLAAAALSAAALALASCGSSGDDPAPPVANEPANSVPASAWNSSSALVSYSAGLAASETSEPLDIDTGTEPASETSEPEEI